MTPQASRLAELALHSVPRKSHRIFAIFTVVTAFVLLVAGGLVSTDVASTAYGSVSTLLLAPSTVLTIHVWRHVSESQGEQISSGAKRAATA